MKLKQFLFAAVIAAMAGMTVVGCNENDPGPNPDPGDDDIAAVTNLEAVSLSETSVGLRWTASTTTGVDEYRIDVRGAGGTSMMMDTVAAGTTNLTIDGLTAGVIYTFGVTAVETDVLSSDDLSAETTVMWSPAERINTDSKVTTSLRLYPRSVSGKGSGIVMTSNGAYNASVAGSGADIGMIQLIADVASNGSTFTIGNPKAAEFNAFSNFANFRSDVEVSDASAEIDPATGLNGWYRSESLEGLFGAGAATKSFTFGDKLSSNNGVGFAVRWGAAGAKRYARVYVVPGANGMLIQTDGGGDRYVEVRISYQDQAGVPYAKGS